MKLWLFVYCLSTLEVLIESQQCVISLVSPQDGAAVRTIRLTQATTQATVSVVCDTTPTVNVVTTLTFTANDVTLTDASAKEVTIFSGQLSAVHVFDFTYSGNMGGGPGSITVTVTSGDVAVATVDAANDNLTFQLLDIPEVSFSPTQYEAQFNDQIQVILVRTEPITDVMTLNVVESGGTSYLSGDPAVASFTANVASATVTLTVTQESTNDLTTTLIMNGVPDTILVTRDTSQAMATVIINGKPLLSVAIAVVQIVPALTTAVFTVNSDRILTRDSAINLAYSDVANIVTTRVNTITIPAGSNTASASISVSPVALQSFVIHMSSATGGACIDATRDSTMYNVVESDVIVSVVQQVYTAVEGDVIQVTLTSNVQAPTVINIDLYTPLQSDSSQFGVLPDAVFTVGTLSTTVNIGILLDGITESTTVSTIGFRSLTPGVVVASGQDSISVTISDSVIILPDTGTGTGTGTGIGTGTDIGTGTNSSGGLSGNAIAGIVVGAVGVLLVVVVFAMIMGLAVMSSRGTASTQPYGAQGYGVYRYPRPTVYEVAY